MELHFNSHHKVEKLVTHPEITLVKDMLNIQMVTNIMATTSTASDKEKENIFMPMAIDMKVILKAISNMELVNLHIKIKANIMVNKICYIRSMGKRSKTRLRNISLC